MDIKKNNFVGDIYTSYGPFVGKVCENTNTQLCKDNIIESITSSINENILSPTQKNTFELGFSKNSPQEQINLDTKILKKIKNIKISKIPKQNIVNSNDNAKIGGNILDIEQNNDFNEQESTSFFNYKVSLFNYKISIWILILILIVLICIGYFIYKYWFLKDNNILTYKKNNDHSDKNNNISLNDESSNDSSSDNASSDNSSENLNSLN
jgi:hypothetical protein